MRYKKTEEFCQRWDVQKHKFNNTAQEGIGEVEVMLKCSGFGSMRLKTMSYLP